VCVARGGLGPVGKMLGLVAPDVLLYGVDHTLVEFDGDGSFGRLVFGMRVGVDMTVDFRYPKKDVFTREQEARRSLV
jgi:hypothetical protein